MPGIHRKVELEGVRNFRDFGGYVGSNGRIASGRFFRSGHHALASDSDLRALQALDVRTLVDLRRPHERVRAPSRRWEEFGATVIQNDDPYEGEEIWEDFLARWDLTPEAFRGYQHRYYSQAPFLPRITDLLGRYFQALATTEGAVLIHCSAGKDRTGLVVALTHAMAGVGPDDIISDYLLTNDPNLTQAPAPHRVKDIHSSRGRTPSAEAMKAALGVDAAYLATAFAEIKSRSGSIEHYLHDTVGIDRRLRNAIEVRLFG